MNLVTVENFLISFSQLRRFVVHVLSFFLFLNSGFSLTFFNVVRKHENCVCIVLFAHCLSVASVEDSNALFHTACVYTLVSS